MVLNWSCKSRNILTLVEVPLSLKKVKNKETNSIISHGKPTDPTPFKKERRKTNKQTNDNV